MAAINTRTVLLQATTPRVLSIGINAAVIAAQAQADLALANAATANATLAVIADDNKLSKGEKPAVILNWNAITAEVNDIKVKADELGVSRATYDAAYSALDTYMGGLDWFVLTTDTTIDGPTFRLKFTDYYSARTALLSAKVTKVQANAVAAQAQADTAFNNAATANAAISDIASDSVLSPVEKQALRLEWNAVVSEKSGINTTSAVYSATATENTAYNSAFQALGTYLNAGVTYTISTTTPPTWLNDANLGTNTAIVGDTFRANWKAMYDTRQALLNDIAIEAGKVAVWSTVSGTGKPADNATVGADWATNVTGAAAVNTAITNAQTAATNAAADASLALAVYDNIASDSVLDRSEKAAHVIPDWTEITGEVNGLKNKADDLGVSRTTYDSAYSALDTYVGGLSPAWNDTTQNTSIVRSTFNTLFSDYRNAKAALLNAIYAKTATMATWATVAGTGRPADNATSDISLVARGGVTIQGNKVIKAGGTNNSWSADARSLNGFVGGAFCSAVVNNFTTQYMFGLNTDPETDGAYPDGAYESLDFAFYIAASNLIYIYESSVIQNSGASFGTAVAGDILAVVYDGVNVVYIQNQTVLRTVAATITLPLFFDSSLHTVGASFDSVRFGPLSSNSWSAVGGTGKPADNATVGAPSGTLVAGVSADTLVAQAAAGNSTATAFASPPVISGLSDVDEHAIVNGSNRLIQTLSVSMTGGEAPYTYVWIEDGPCFLSAYTGASVELRGSGNNVLHTGRVTCTGRDAKGRFSSMSIAYTAGFGSE